MTAPLLPIDDLLVPTAPEKGPPPKARVNTAAQAIEIYHKLRRADLVSALNRVAIQGMFDGAPPYDDAFLRGSGQGSRCNLDFGEAGENLEKAMSAYVDLFYSVDRLITVKTKYGALSQRPAWEDIISEEWTRMVRSWPALDHSFLYCCQQFIIHGVSICYYENELDWRWRVSPFGNFLIPRRTLATQDKLEISCAMQSYQVNELFAFIEDEAIATKAGWNVPAVRRAIAKAMPGARGVTYENWEVLQTDLKDNDLYWGNTASEVRVVHVWVQEFSGKISHYMALETDEEKEWLYEKRDRFENTTQTFTFFTYGIGTNGYYHGIRGLGFKIFPLIQYSNRLIGQEMDAAMLASGVMVQPESEEVADNMEIVNYGPYNIVPPGMNFIERAAPNLIQTVEPALNRMGQMIQRRAGQYTNNIPSGGPERTKFQVASELEDLAKLSLTSLHLFYAPWGRHLRESFRRTIREDYVPAEPGGVEVAEFRRRCFERGVPLEAIFKCDVSSVQPVQAVGAGSGAARKMSINNMMQISGSLDEVGRNRVLTEFVACEVGRDNAKLYVPPIEGPRPTTDDKMANMENALMDTGKELPIYSNDLHLVHARTHLESLNQDVAMVEQGQTEIAQVTPLMLIKHTHTTAHVEAMANDPTTASEAAMYRQNLQQVGEIIYNGVKHIQKLQRQAQEQGAEGQDPNAPQQGPSQAELDQEKWARSLESQILSSRAKLQMEQERHVQNLAMSREKFAQDMALKDAETAAKLRRESINR